MTRAYVHTRWGALIITLLLLVPGRAQADAWYNFATTTGTLSTGAVCVANGTDISCASPNPTVDGSGNVGIGTTTMTGKVNVKTDSTLTNSAAYGIYLNGDQSAASSSQYTAILAAPSYTSSSGTLDRMYGGNFSPRNASTGTLNLLYGVNSNPANIDDGYVTAIYGVTAFPSNSSTGTAGSLYGVVSSPGKYGTGVVGSAYALYGTCTNANATGALTNCYGLFLATPTATGTITNRWGVYQQDPNTNNWFAGNINIGTNVASVSYLNFGGTLGTSGYGIRDNSGTIEVKNSGGAWAAPSGGSSQWTTAGSDIYYNTGKVGIGTTGPATALEIAGISAVLSLSGNGGKVGIGTTNPSTILHAIYNAATNVQIRVQNSNAGAGVRSSVQALSNGSRSIEMGAKSSSDSTSTLGASGATYLTSSSAASEFNIINESVSGGLKFYSGSSATGTPRIVLLPDGKVAVGTTAANHILDVNGNVGIASGGYVNFDTTTGSGGYGIRDNGGTIEIKNSGGSWAAPGGGSGAAGSTGQFQYNNSSVLAGTQASWDATNETLVVGNATSPNNLYRAIFGPHSAYNHEQAVIAVANSTRRLEVGIHSAATYLDPSANGTADFVIGKPWSGGTRYLTLNSSTGRFAIGTSTASHTLDVRGNIGIGTGAGYLNFNTTTGSTGYGIRDNAGIIEIKNSGGAWAAPSGGSSQWTTSGNNIYYNTGNVGIGTASPTFPFSAKGVHVQNPSGHASIFVDAPAGSAAMFNMGKNGSSIWHFERNLSNDSFGIAETGVAYRLTILQGGNVGIGTTVPATALHLASNTALRVGDAYLGGTDGSFAHLAYNAWYNGSAWNIPNAGQSSTLIQLGQSSIGFWTTPSAGSTAFANALTINASGITCIATRCPTNGAVRMTPNFHLNSMAAAAVIVNWDNGTTGATQTFRIGNGAAGGDVFYVRADGATMAPAFYDINNTGYYVDPNGTSTLSGLILAGAITSPTGTALCISSTTSTVTKGTSSCNISDERVKQDIRPLAAGLAGIMKLKPVSFRWRPEFNKEDKRTKLGLIAQDVKQIFPDAVTGKGTGKNGDWYGLDYAALTAPIVKAIQELKAANDNVGAESAKNFRELRKEIESLKSDNDNLRQEIGELRHALHRGRGR